MTFKCPHCGKKSEVQERAIVHCENYGDEQYDLRCTKCNGPVHVFLYLTVKLNEVAKGAFERDYWGERTSYAVSFTTPVKTKKAKCPKCKQEIK